MHLTFSLLGNFQLTLDGNPVTGFRTDKERALLTLLVLDHQRPHRRENLAGLFWGDQPQKLAANNLRKTIFRLRQTLADDQQPESYLRITAKEIQWHSATAVSVDVWDFTHLLDQSRKHPHRRLSTCQFCQEILLKAVTLYRGNLLDGFALGDSPLFDEWVTMRREPLRVEALSALNQLITYHEQSGQTAQVETLARQMLALEPWQESAHRTLMRLWAMGGDRGSAITQYETCRALLASDLGIKPERETTALYEAIKQEQALVAPSPNRFANNLPISPTPFMGRGAEMRNLCQLLLHPETRLVTVVGEGGIGKTRLALATATQVQHDFPDGVWFVDFSSLTEVEEMPAFPPARLLSRLAITIATTLDLPLSGSQPPTTQLLNTLKNWQCLLVLDNFETVMAGASLIADLLRATTGVVVLATSREPLHLQAEQMVRLSGLPVPIADTPPNAWQDYDSLRLFQASVSRMGGAIGTDELPLVSQICRFLEGIPLGIELAAAWTPRLSLAEILTTLQKQAATLALPYHDMPARHRSMAAVFAGSWRLLTPPQQTALGQLSVFQGGFTHTAAAQIISVPWAEVVVLTDKSLLRLGQGGRYSLHELLRQFAAERLEMPAETNQRHYQYYLSYLADHTPALWGHTPQHALATLRLDFENIHMAWRGAVADQQWDLLGQSLASLVTYYTRTGLYHEGIQVLTATLTATTLHPLRGWLQVELARLCAAVGQFAAAKQFAEAGVENAGIFQNSAMQGWGQFRWGRTLWMQGNYDACRPLLESALTIAQANGLVQLEAECWLAFSALADTHGGDFALARQHGEQALTLFQRMGNRTGELRMLILLGNFGWGVGDYALAQDYYEQSLVISRDIASQQDEAATLANLGTVLREQGEYAQAILYYAQAIQLFQKRHDQRREFITLKNMSLLQHQQAQPLLALRYARQSLAMARELETRAGESQPYCCLGHALFALNQPDEARNAYQSSVALHRNAGNNHLAMEPLAGLVRVALAKGDTKQAIMDAEEIWAHLATGTLHGTDEPIRVMLSVYQAFATAQDPRAKTVLHTAYQLLQTRSLRISDPVRRQSFMENIPAHRELQKIWASQSSTDE